MRLSVSHMRVPGAKCFAVENSGDLKAFDPRASECQFLGYDQASKSYRLRKVGGNSVICLRDIIFHEHSSSTSCPSVVTYPDGDDLSPAIMSGQLDPSVGPVPLEPLVTPTLPSVASDLPIDVNLDKDDFPPIEPDWEKKTSCLPPEVEVALPRRLSRAWKPSRKVREMVHLASLPDVPKTYKHMLRSPERDKWEHAWLDEFCSWKEKGVYRVVCLPNGCRRLGTKPVYAWKTDAKGNVERHKARCVVLENLQRPDLEFTKTSSPTACTDTLRTMCAIAASQNWELHQMDVKTAFLHSNIDCTIHLSIPNGFPEDKLPVGVPHEELALLLDKAVYGLCQVGHLWFEHCAGAFMRLGFTQSGTGPCLFFINREGTRSWVLVYVDDFTILANSAAAMLDIKTLLLSAYDLKDLGEVKQILGLEVEHDRNKGTLRLFQRKYLRNLVSELGMENCVPVYTPMEVRLQLKNHSSGSPGDALTHAERVFMVDKPYLCVLGSLNRIADGSCPNVAFALSFLAQHAKEPGPGHWKALMRVVSYLHTTIDSGLTYS